MQVSGNIIIIWGGLYIGALKKRTTFKVFLKINIRFLFDFHGIHFAWYLGMSTSKFIYLCLNQIIDKFYIFFMHIS